MLNVSEKSSIDELLDENVIDFINSILDRHYYLLLQAPEYKKLDRKLADMEEELKSSISDDTKLLLDKYKDTIYKMNVYECSIIYYIGIKFGINIQKLN